MTKTEALTYSVIEFNVNSNLVDKILIDNGVTGSETYTASDYAEIELCKAYIYKNLATSPDFKQGSLSISNKQSNKLLAEANRIFKRNGLLSEIANKTKISFLNN